MDIVTSLRQRTVLEVLFLVWRDMLPEIRKCQSH